MLAMMLTDLMKERYAAGTLGEDPVEYARRAEGSASSGQELKHEFRLPNNRVIVGSNCPRPDGGWVSTFTKTLLIAKASNCNAPRSIGSRSGGRLSIWLFGTFRDSASLLLTEVNDSMVSMRETANRLLESSGNTSQRVSASVISFSRKPPQI